MNELFDLARRLGCSSWSLLRMGEMAANAGDASAALLAADMASDNRQEVLTAVANLPKEQQSDVLAVYNEAFENGYER